MRLSAAGASGPAALWPELKGLRQQPARIQCGGKITSTSAIDKHRWAREQVAGHEHVWRIMGLGPSDLARTGHNSAAIILMRTAALLHLRTSTYVDPRRHRLSVARRGGTISVTVHRVILCMANFGARSVRSLRAGTLLVLLACSPALRIDDCPRGVVPHAAPRQALVQDVPECNLGAPPLPTLTVAQAVGALHVDNRLSTGSGDPDEVTHTPILECVNLSIDRGPWYGISLTGKEHPIVWNDAAASHEVRVSFIIRSTPFARRQRTPNSACTYPQTRVQQLLVHRVPSAVVPVKNNDDALSLDWHASVVIGEGRVDDPRRSDWPARIQKVEPMERDYPSTRAYFEDARRLSTLAGDDVCTRTALSQLDHVQRTLRPGWWESGGTWCGTLAAEQRVVWLAARRIRIEHARCLVGNLEAR